MSGAASEENPAVLRVAGVTFTFAGRSEPSLVDTDFTIAPGSFTVVAGRSGSGKSTLLRALAGLIPRHSQGTLVGSIRLRGSDVGHETSTALDVTTARPSELATRVGLVQQSNDDQICAHTVEGELAFGLANLCLPVVEIEARLTAALDDAGLSDKRFASIEQLSGGQKQRLVLASILAMRPEILLCDEPLAQLDPQAAEEFLSNLDRLHARGTTLIVAEHRLDELWARADRLLVLDAGCTVGDVSSDDLSGVCESLRQGGLEPPELLQLAERLNVLPDDGRAGLAAALATRVRARGASSGAGSVGPVRSQRESSATPLVEARGIGFQYPNAREPVWNNVDLTLRPGEMVAVVGPNGCGKSTLLATLVGLLEPTAGTLRRPQPRAGSLESSLLLQNPDLMLFSRSVAEELAFGPRQLGLAGDIVDERVARVARQLGLEAFLNDPPLALSRGQRLRVALASLLTLEPRLLLLDEPTTGQDPPQTRAILESLQALATRDVDPLTVVFSTHDLRTAVQFAERILVINEGRLAADLTPDELLGSVDVLHAAGLRLTPLLKLRQDLALQGMTAAALARELAS